MAPTTSITDLNRLNVVTLTPSALLMIEQANPLEASGPPLE